MSAQFSGHVSLEGMSFLQCREDGELRIEDSKFLQDHDSPFSIFNPPFSTPIDRPKVSVTSQPEKQDDTDY